MLYEALCCKKIWYNEGKHKLEGAMIFILMILISLVFVWKIWSFYESNYYVESGNNYRRTVVNSQKYNQYLTFRCLQKMEVYQRILLNVNLSKDDDSTAVVPILSISNRGVVLVEAMNCRGFIHGDESSLIWTQTLPGGSKKNFYNPVWQIKGQIKAFNRFFDGEYSRVLSSFVVFNGISNINGIGTNNQNVRIVKRNRLFKALVSDKEAMKLTNEEVDRIYNALEAYSCDEDDPMSLHKV